MGQGDWPPRRGRLSCRIARNTFSCFVDPHVPNECPQSSPNPWEQRLPSRLLDHHDVHPSTEIAPVEDRRSLPASFPTLNPNPSVRLGETGASLLLPRGTLRNGLALRPTPWPTERARFVASTTLYRLWRGVSWHAREIGCTHPNAPQLEEHGQVRPSVELPATTSRQPRKHCRGHRSRFSSAVTLARAASATVSGELRTG